jgi:lysophospholipase L1-like esterase
MARDNGPRVGASATRNVFERHPVRSVVVIVLVGFVAVVFAFEKYLAWTAPESDARPGVERHIRLRELPPGMVAFNTFTGEVVEGGPTARAYRLEVERNGFVFPSRVHEDADADIVFLGGSTTQCTYLDERARYPYLAGKFLEEGGLRVNAYNGGVSGNHTLHSIDVLLNKVVPLSPDIVVMMHNINDLGILLFEGTYWSDHWNRSLIVSLPPPQPPSGRRVARELKNWLIPRLWARLRALTSRGGNAAGADAGDEWAHVRGHSVDVDSTALTAAFAANLRLFVSVCRTRGITPVLMTQPNRLTEEPDEFVRAFFAKLESDFGIEYARYRAAYRAFNQTIRDVGAATGVLVIDLAAEIPQERAYMYDGIHLNEAGARLVARIIADTLEPALD